MFPLDELDHTYRVLSAGLIAAEVVVDADKRRLERDRERIFDRFARGRASAPATSEGAGPGLSLVALHLHRLGGSVPVTLSPGGRARFVISPPGLAPTHPEDQPCAR